MRLRGISAVTNSVYLYFEFRSVVMEIYETV